MKYVINSLDDISDYLLEILNLDIAIQHQEWVWNGDVYAFNCTALCLACGVAVLFGGTTIEVIYISVTLVRLDVRGMHHYLVCYLIILLY